MSKTKDKKLLFVYGSLRQGMGNHKVIKEGTYLGKDAIAGPVEMLDWGAYPAVIWDDSKYGKLEGRAVGEVYEVNDDTYKAVERLEGYPSFYNRMDVDTVYGEAEMYIIPKDHYHAASPKVDSGDWVAHKKFKELSKNGSVQMQN